MSAVSTVDTFMLLDQLQVSEYRSPEIELGSREATDDEWWLFVGVLVVVWAAVLAYGAYCTSRGGNFYYEWSWWPPGWRVSCWIR